MPKAESTEKAPWATRKTAKGGCLSTLLITNLWAILTACLFLLFKPTAPSPTYPAPSANLIEKLKSGVNDLETPVVIQESELNAWIAHRLSLEMESTLLEPLLQGQGVTLDLRPDEVDFIIHWNLAGLPHHWKLTFSVLRKINRVTLIGGEIGHMPLRGAFLNMVFPAFQRLLNELNPEYQLFLKYRSWEITDQQITLLR